jgi:hypothetical protein
MGDNHLMRNFGQDNDRNLFWDRVNDKGLGKEKRMYYHGLQKPKIPFAIRLEVGERLHEIHWGVT